MNRYTTIGLAACAMLVYEILLTRVCALRLDFHYSFLVISVGLLGIGAAGSLVFLCQERFRRDPQRWTLGLALVFAASLPPTYAFLVGFPVDARVSIGAGRGFASFALYVLVSGVPFFFGGALVGWLLTRFAADVHRLYAVDLLGAGLGCLVTPFAIARVGAGGCLGLAVVLALGAAAAAAPRQRRGVAHALLLASLLLGALVPRLDTWLSVPSKGEIAVTPDVSLDLDRRLFQRWSAISRVDLFAVPEGASQVFGRGAATAGMPLPAQAFVLQDGSAGTYVTDFTGSPAGLEVLARSLYATAVSLKDAPRVFVIGVGGGPDVWAAKHAGARRIKGVELNAAILDVHREVVPGWSRGLLEDPTIELVAAEGRSALLREDELYDVVQMSGIDTWTALTSGAYMLAENYLYTVEAAGDMLERLAPGGLLQVTRFSQAPEAVRLLANLREAWGERGLSADFADSVVCLHVPPLMTIVARRGAFPPHELARLDAFAARAGIELLYRPGASFGNELELFLRADDPRAFLERFPLDVSPVHDDRPYFFQFVRFGDLEQARETLDAPSSVVQGNPLFLLAQLALVTLAALLLTLLPLALARRKPSGGAGTARFLVYFACVGLGFIGIEIAAMQKLVLLLGHPLHSITVTLFCTLVFTGLGSYLSRALRATARTWLVPLGLAVCVTAFLLASPWAARALATAPPWMRFAAAGALIAPIALLLGVPFALGIRLLEARSPSLVPWAWAVNACATVVGSVGAAMLSMEIGFRGVLVVSVAVYGVAFAALPLPAPGPSERTAP